MEINLFKTKKSFKKKNLELRPELYWKIMVAIVAVSIIASFVFGYNLFNEIRADLSSYTENFNKKQPVRKERLQRALEYFSSREKKSEDILSSPAPVVDPSI